MGRCDLADDCKMRSGCASFGGFLLGRKREIIQFVDDFTIDNSTQQFIKILREMLSCRSVESHYLFFIYNGILHIMKRIRTFGFRLAE